MVRHLNSLFTRGARNVRRSLVLDNDSALIAPLVGYLQQETAAVTGCSAEDAGRIALALEEALANALFHGNLELGSHLRREGDDVYYALAERRCKQPPYRDRRTRVEARLSPEEAIFTIRDEGPGFDPCCLLDPSLEEALETVRPRAVSDAVPHGSGHVQ